LILQVKIVLSKIFSGKCEIAMHKMIRSMSLMLLPIILLSSMSALGQNGIPENSISQKLALNIYLDKTGKALVTGYVQDIRDLPFLGDSQYRYENETLQLYALTDSLTQKDGNIWNLEFSSRGYFDDYRATFYLPTDLMLKSINNTPGLNYLLSTSNQSMIADFQGFEVLDPSVTIEYQQPLQQETNSSSESNNRLISGVIFLLLMALGFILFLKMQKMRKSNSRNTPSSEELQKSDALEAHPSVKTEENASLQDTGLKQTEDLEDEKDLDHDTTPIGPSEQEEIAEEMESTPLDPDAIKSPAGKDIEVTKEMAAVMETLTSRERSILETVILAGGRTTQAELRYKTGTPKSTLSGILSSLERRKLIVKKEWGRTNVIELSDTFLSGKKHS
jgi:hypothetical protein